VPTAAVVACVVVAVVALTIAHKEFSLN